MTVLAPADGGMEGELAAPEPLVLTPAEFADSTPWRARCRRT